MDVKVAYLYAGTKINANIFDPSDVDTALMHSYAFTHADELIDGYMSKMKLNPLINILRCNAFARMDCFVFACVSFWEIRRKSLPPENKTSPLQMMEFSRKMMTLCRLIVGEFAPDNLSEVFDNRICLYDVFLSSSGLTEKMSNILKHVLAKDLHHNVKFGLDDIMMDDNFSPAVTPGSKEDRNFQEQCDAFTSFIWEAAMAMYFT